jgi:hypothetical protein
MSQGADAKRARAAPEPRAPLEAIGQKTAGSRATWTPASAARISKDLSSSVKAQSHRSSAPRRAPRFQIRDRHRQARLARPRPRGFAALAFLERCGVDSGGMPTETN